MSSPDRSSRPRVYSRRKGAEKPPSGAMYVGRGTLWGNPWRIGLDGTREEVVARYREFVMDPGKAPLRERIRTELGGKDLVCWCAPEACHADVLLAVANATVADRLADHASDRIVAEHARDFWQGRALEAEAEVERLRTALEFIARDRWTRDPIAQALQDIARRTLEKGA